MEILVRRNDLVKELQLVQGIVERKNSIPILSNVLAEARAGELRISATDLDVSLRCGCAAQVVEEGAVTLGAKKLYEIVRSLPESDVQREGRGRRLGHGSSASGSSSRWPACRARTSRACPRRGQARPWTIPVGVLRGLIQRTSFAITAEDARYYLAGALLVLDKDAVAMVATDGHRLAWAQKTTTLKVRRSRPGSWCRARPSPSSPGSSRTWAATRWCPSSRARGTSSSRPAGGRSPRRWSRPSSRPSRRSSP